jgi:hypothetical protein
MNRILLTTANRAQTHVRLLPEEGEALKAFFVQAATALVSVRAYNSYRYSLHGDRHGKKRAVSD